jgi:hypothetical protein
MRFRAHSQSRRNSGIATGRTQEWPSLSFLFIHVFLARGRVVEAPYLSKRVALFVGWVLELDDRLILVARIPVVDVLGDGPRIRDSLPVSNCRFSSRVVSRRGILPP